MRHIALLLCSWLLMTACSTDSGTPTDEAQSVYYWRTDFSIDSTELAFLHRHNIRKIYCRYFDVVAGQDGRPVPNATITFSSPVPDSVELVPTVFITEDCMHRYPDSLAMLVVRRIAQMNETNDIGGVREIQIDCDYTARSRQTYYDFLRAVAHSSPFKLHFSRLSTTIRLHQLSMPAPPVDYGVLMLYNTGDPRRFYERRSADGSLLEEGRNPILDMRDVAPYLRHLPDYPLPLAAAYPVFRWERTIYGVNIEHTADIDEILNTKQAVEARRSDLRRQVIVYHLAEENINRYKPDDYEAIFHH